MISYQNNKTILLQPSGRLDLEGGLALKQQLDAIKFDHYSLWILDLTHIDFIDSAGITALITGHKLAVTHQCRFVLYNPCPAVRLVFEITRLDQVFEIYDAPFSEAEAGTDPLPQISLLKLNNQLAA
jgi:anti-anti-sigma factor